MKLPLPLSLNQILYQYTCAINRLCSQRGSCVDDQLNIFRHGYRKWWTIRSKRWHPSNKNKKLSNWVKVLWTQTTRLKFNKIQQIHGRLNVPKLLHHEPELFKQCDWVISLAVFRLLKYLTPPYPCSVPVIWLSIHFGLIMIFSGFLYCL